MQRLSKNIGQAQFVTRVCEGLGMSHWSFERRYEVHPCECGKPLCEGWQLKEVAPNG